MQPPVSETADSFIYVITRLLGVAPRPKRTDLVASGVLIGLLVGFVTDTVVTAGGVGRRIPQDVLRDGHAYWRLPAHEEAIVAATIDPTGQPTVVPSAPESVHGTWSVAAQWLRRGLIWGCPLILLALLLWHRSTVDAGTDVLGHADREWLTLAGASAASTWLAASCCQIGATSAKLPFTRVFAVQVAGSFLNHVLPAGAGVATLNLRMLRRAGLTRSHAAGAVTLNAAAGIVVHLLALAVLFGLDPRFGRLSSTAFLISLALASAAVISVGLVTWRLSGRFNQWRTTLRSVFDQIRTVLRRPAHAVMLWAGSAAIPALHILTLTAVLHALGMPAPLALIALAYLSASALSALIPAPGGFGGLDIALVAALAGVGVSAPSAIAAVIAYRLLTVWLPLLPGAATFVVLLRRRIV